MNLSVVNGSNLTQIYNDSFVYLDDTTKRALSAKEFTLDEVQNFKVNGREVTVGFCGSLAEGIDTNTYEGLQGCMEKFLAVRLLISNYEGQEKEFFYLIITLYSDDNVALMLKWAESTKQKLDSMGNGSVVLAYWIFNYIIKFKDRKTLSLTYRYRFKEDEKVLALKQALELKYRNVQ